MNQVELSANANANAKREYGWYVPYSFSPHSYTQTIFFTDEQGVTILPSPPFDSISSVRYSPTNPDHLLVSSWDTVIIPQNSFFFVRSHQTK
jgi:hypothetical protein